MRRADLVDRIATGGFPDIVAIAVGRRAWFDNYLDGDAVSDPRDFADERLCRNAACASALRRACRRRKSMTLANDLSIPARTTAGYLALRRRRSYPPGAGLV